MANLQEVVSWDTGVYQLETNDPVLGGPGGTSNKQAQALANRTAYLKKHTDDIEGGTTAAGKANKLTTARLIALGGDVNGQASFDGSSNISITVTYKNSGVVAGTYRSVTVDEKGNITAGTNPTTLSGYGITDAVPSSQKGAASGVATLDGAGKVPVPQIPVVAIIERGNNANGEYIKFADGTMICWRTYTDPSYSSLTNNGSNVKLISSVPMPAAFSSNPVGIIFPLWKTGESTMPRWCGNAGQGQPSSTWDFVSFTSAPVSNIPLSFEMVAFGRWN